MPASLDVRVPTGPNQKWAADFTYVWTGEGWLFVAVVLDHQYCRVWRAAAFGTRRARRGGIDACRQRLEIHMLGQAHRRVAQFRSPVLTFLLGK